MAVRSTGTIVKWIDEKGYGFLKRDESPSLDSPYTGDVFLHSHRVIKGWPREGARVEFELDVLDGKRRANNAVIF